MEGGDDLIRSPMRKPKFHRITCFLNGEMVKNTLYILVLIGEGSSYQILFMESNRLAKSYPKRSRWDAKLRKMLKTVSQIFSLAGVVIYFSKPRFTCHYSNSVGKYIHFKSQYQITASMHLPERSGKHSS